MLGLVLVPGPQSGAVAGSKAGDDRPVPAGDVVFNDGLGMGIDLFSNLGIDPKQQKILVVKSNQHFYAAFSKIAAEVIYAEADGALPRDFRKLPWSKIERPIWPLDAETEPKLII